MMLHILVIGFDGFIVLYFITLNYTKLHLFIHQVGGHCNYFVVWMHDFQSAISIDSLA